jgi:hypothetical protein
MYPAMFAERPEERDIFRLPYLERLPEYKSGNKKSLGRFNSILRKTLGLFSVRLDVVRSMSYTYV